MGDSRKDRPTDSEYAGQPGVDRETPSTLRVASEEVSTLRIGSDSSAPATALEPWRLRYEEEDVLARGGMSTVHSVRDRILRRRVAMKLFDNERDPGGLGYFVQEARVTAQLDHPNIVPVHDLQFDETGRPSRFTMKLVEGETLTSVLERTKPSELHGRALERMLAITLKICDAVAFAHSRGVIHCDLKPANIMVGSHGQVYVMDWGVAHRLGVADTEASGDRTTREYGEVALSGTPVFMAPEQAWGRREEVDQRTDVYGIGGLLYSILTRTPPHDGGTIEIDLALAKEGAVQEPQARVPDVRLPPGLCRIAMRALASRPEDRYQSVSELREDLERFLRGGGWFEAMRVEPGEVIVREGDAPDAAYIVTEGECEVYRTVSGKKRVMQLLGAGEVFGETSIFGASSRTANVAASKPTTLLRVTRDALERELERSEWLRSFVEALAKRFIELDQKLRKLEG